MNLYLITCQDVKMEQWEGFVVAADTPQAAKELAMRYTDGMAYFGLQHIKLIGTAAEDSRNKIIMDSFVHG